MPRLQAMSEELPRIEAVLERTSMRLGARAAIVGAWRAAVLMSAFSLVAAVVQRLSGNAISWLPLIGFSLFCTFLWALLQWATRRPGPLVTAAWIDAMTGNHDRVATAHGLAKQPGLSHVQSLALKDCMGWLEKFQPRQLAPLQAPRGFSWLMAPWISIFLLVLTASPPTSIPPPGDDAALAQHADALNDVAKLSDSPEIQAALDEAADQIRSADADERQREILKQLGRLEDQLRDAQESGLSEASLNALAEALGDQRRQELFQQAISEKLQQTEISKALEELLKALTPEQKQALQELADAAASKGSQLSQEEQESVLEQMEQALERSEQMAAIREALRELAQQLQQSADNRPRTTASNPSPPPTLEQLLQMLERMKQAARDGEAPDQFGQPQPGDAPQDGEGTVQLSMGGEGTGQPAEDGSAGATPGADANAELFADEGPAERVTGEIGDGEIARETLASSAAGDRARRDILTNMEAVPSDEQAAQIPETIPLGSKRMIQRYFEILRGIDE